MPLLTAKDQARAARIIDNLNRPGSLFYSEADAKWLAWNIPCDGGVLDPVARMWGANTRERPSKGTQTTGHVPGHGNVTIDTSANVPQKRTPKMHWVGKYEISNAPVPHWTKIISFGSEIVFASLVTVVKLTGSGEIDQTRMALIRKAKAVEGREFVMQIFPMGFATKGEVVPQSMLKYRVRIVDGKPECTTVGFVPAVIIKPDGSMRPQPKKYPDWMCE